MDKRTFITQLRQALSVLQKDELEDIVTEYEQHIDMKMKNGLSEEEAIADFGGFEELTAEILSAYHVRADYAQGQKKERKRLFPEEGTAGKELLAQTSQTCRTVGEKAAGGVRGLGAWLLGILSFWKQKLGGGFSRIGSWWKSRRQTEAVNLEEDWDEGYHDRESLYESGNMPKMKTEAADSREPAGIQGGDRAASVSRQRAGIHSGRGVLGGVRSFFRKLTSLAAACLHLGLALAAWGIRMIWNLCWIGFACFCACFGLFSLFTLGMLTVLLMQHYPLAGVTVGCLGLVLCFFSAAWFSVTLLWRKRIQVSNEEMEGGQHA